MPQPTDPAHPITEDWDEEASGPILDRPSRANLKWWVIGVVGALAMVAFISWAIVDDYRNKAVWQDVRNEVIDDHTFRMEFTITRPEGREAVCTVRAMAADLSTVGSAEVTVPASTEATSRITETIRTNSKAAGGGVRECVLR
ncbi:DUF4307 domain-containing protein [Kribbia dieselivorans]|uniref:DUF4307 domain-containing protein n=1 Tax=Kribbia dieselivorans TaxID=331526 RepID=UPI00083852AC|nr:DUF4307 domain-containing protein [Kribbia dieselivorans]